MRGARHLPEPSFGFGPLRASDNGLRKVVDNLPRLTALLSGGQISKRRGIMATVNLPGFLRTLTRGMAAETWSGRSDQELISGYLARRNEAVFEAMLSSERKTRPLARSRRQWRRA
jgi:hypothetical protein